MHPVLCAQIVLHPKEAIIHLGYSHQLIHQDETMARVVLTGKDKDQEHVSDQVLRQQKHIMQYRVFI